LESTIKHHEDTLQNLQNSHRNAADECLMLRYKNSLLERILLEKGSPNLINSSVCQGTYANLLLHQVSTSRLSCARRLAVQTWGRPGPQRLHTPRQTRRLSNNVLC
jgi:hypothetical protein